MNMLNCILNPLKAVVTYTWLNFKFSFLNSKKNI